MFRCDCTMFGCCFDLVVLGLLDVGLLLFVLLIVLFKGFLWYGLFCC